MINHVVPTVSEKYIPPCKNISDNMQSNCKSLKLIERTFFVFRH